MIEAVMYGMIPSPKTARRPERPAGEQVDEGEEPGLALLLELPLELGDVHHRHRDVRAEPVHGDDEQREEDLVPEIRDLEGVEEGLSTVVLSYPGLAENLGSAPGLLDLRLGGVREGVGLHGERVVDLAAREDLHGTALADEPVLVQSASGVTSPSAKYLREHLDVHDANSSRFGFVKPLSLGTRRCSGIWPPSNPARDVLARARSPSCRGRRSCRARRRGRARPACGPCSRAFGGLQVMELHPSHLLDVDEVVHLRDHPADLGACRP